MTPADKERARQIIAEWDALPNDDPRDYVEQLAPIIAAALAAVREETLAQFRASDKSAREAAERIAALASAEKCDCDRDFCHGVRPPIICRRLTPDDDALTVARAYLSALRENSPADGGT